jgi:hypothetical protein
MYEIVGELPKKSFSNAKSQKCVLPVTPSTAFKKSPSNGKMWQS